MRVQASSGLEDWRSWDEVENVLIVVLDMGESMKILDVARQMIALSGYQEGEDIEIEFIGLKPSEKLYEEVQHLSETLQSTDHAVRG
jgi:FlaA1/EpsC-like NDP-sugar epimerase